MRDGGGAPPDGACRSCGEALVDGARYCTGCGAPTSPRERAVRGAPPAPSPRLVECDACGAGNAASRLLCARCAAPLRDEVVGGTALPEPVAADRAGAAARRDVPSLALALVLLAALVTAGVLLSLVTARFRSADGTGVPPGVPLEAASASSALAGHAADRVADGDPRTAWTEAAPGTGEGQWVQVTTGGEVLVGEVVVYAGDQADAATWAAGGRPSLVRVEVGDRQFRVRLRPVLGPQPVSLPDPVRADRVRLVVEEVRGGADREHLAISEVVLVAADGAPPPTGG
jgi:hypothetical protein